MKTKKRKRLGRKLLSGFALFGLLIVLFANYFVVPRLYNAEKDEYSRLAFCYARTAARYIDGDRVLKYLEETGVNEYGNTQYYTDDYYIDIMSFLMANQQECKIMDSFYVVLPDEEGYTYIWDALNDDQPRPRGYYEEYDADGKEILYDNAFTKNPTEKMATFVTEEYGYIGCAYYPIFDKSGEPVACVGVDLQMGDILNATIHSIIVVNTLLLIFIIIALTLGYLFLKHKLILPIANLNNATKKMVENLDQCESFDLNIHTHDELEDLADSFGKMTRDLLDYINKLKNVTAEKERISTELNIATQIQADMLPCIFPPYSDRDEFDLFASMTPAKEVGGDFYDFFMIDDDHLTMVIGDVSGKGVPAALFMVISKTLIKDHATMNCSPKTLLEDVNELLLESNSEGMFVTVWLGILEISTGKIVAANAGHEYPAIQRADGKFELFKDKHGMMVGAMGGIKFKEYEMKLEKGDCLFVYTDGVPEATNADNKLYGTDRMIEALNKDPQADPKTILANVKEDVDAFVGEAPQFDDLTMLSVRYFGSTEKK